MVELFVDSSCSVGNILSPHGIPTGGIAAARDTGKRVFDINASYCRTGF